MPDTVELLGRQFQVAPKLGLMPLLRYAHYAKSGISTDDLEGLAAVYELLQGVIADEDWGAFEAHAIATRAEAEELMEASRAAIEVMTARPTVRPSDSSDGPTSAETSSLGSSSSQESSTPLQGTPSNVARRQLGPIADDPRVQELTPLTHAMRAV